VADRHFERGAERGDLRLAAPASKTARLVFGALQGALLVQRTTGDASQLKDVVTVIKAQLAPDRPAAKRAIHSRR
jgi:TetR/AcrR family transcriptional regulator, transcriptional repressor for nem operon